MKLRPIAKAILLAIPSGLAMSVATFAHAQTTPQAQPPVKAATEQPIKASTETLAGIEPFAAEVINTLNLRSSASKGTVSSDCQLLRPFGKFIFADWFAVASPFAAVSGLKKRLKIPRLPGSSFSSAAS